VAPRLTAAREQTGRQHRRDEMAAAHPVIMLDRCGG
jgi:hypothetical protein